jgi:hypothetical protein
MQERRRDRTSIIAHSSRHNSRLQTHIVMVRWHALASDENAGDHDADRRGKDRTRSFIASIPAPIRTRFGTKYRPE